MTIKRKLAGALALTLVSTLAACNAPGALDNRSLYSVKQPVVARTSYTMDVATTYDGLSIPEQQRLSGWFDSMDLRYGDRVSIEDPLVSGATREAVARIAARHGLLLADGAPVTDGFLGQAQRRQLRQCDLARLRLRGQRQPGGDGRQSGRPAARPAGHRRNCDHELDQGDRDLSRQGKHRRRRSEGIVDGQRRR